MRFQNVVASILIVALASSSSMVAAQAEMSEACGNCLTKSAQSVKACNGFDPNMDPAKAAADKTCYCTMASNTAWVEKCNSDCGADFTSLVIQGFKYGKDTYCKGVDVSANGNAGCALSVSKSAGVAMALAGVFVQAIL